MTDRPAPPFRLLSELEHGARYRTPDVREFVGLTPPTNGQKARIRFRLLNEIELDLPVTEESLNALYRVLEAALR